MTTPIAEEDRLLMFSAALPNFELTKLGWVSRILIFGGLISSLILDNSELKMWIATGVCIVIIPVLIEYRTSRIKYAITTQGLFIMRRQINFGLVAIPLFSWDAIGSIECVDGAISYWLTAPIVEVSGIPHQVNRNGIIRKCKNIATVSGVITREMKRRDLEERLADRAS